MMKKIIKILSRPFCRHKYMPFMSVRAHLEDNRYVMKTLWKCKKCGKEKLGK